MIKVMKCWWELSHHRQRSWSWSGQVEIVLTQQNPNGKSGTPSTRGYRTLPWTYFPVWQISEKLLHFRVLHQRLHSMASHHWSALKKHRNIHMDCGTQNPLNVGLNKFSLPINTSASFLQNLCNMGHRHIQGQNDQHVIPLIYPLSISSHSMVLVHGGGLLSSNRKRQLAIDFAVPFPLCTHPANWTVQFFPKHKTCKAQSKIPVNWKQETST